MKKVTRIFIVLVMSLLLFISCGENKSDTTTSKKADTVQSSQKEQKITVEKACKLNNEVATLLMQNYWGKFKGKDYKDVKDIYEKYLIEEDAIYNKYGVSTGKSGFNVQSYQYWKRDNRSDLKKFRKEHPEYDFYVKFPEFLDANAQVLKYAMDKLSESRGK